jgi:hypothetical protein
LADLTAEFDNTVVVRVPQSIETRLATVVLHAAKRNYSYLGMGVPAEAISEPPDYGERIRLDVINKGEKRSHWTGPELKTDYLVAIDDRSIFFYIDRYNMELFGDSVTGASEAALNYEIREAVKNGWEAYLRKMFVLKDNGTVIPEHKRGIFFTEPLSRNLTALLTHGGTGYYLLANPITEPMVNDPLLLQDFKDCRIGWEP